MVTEKKEQQQTWMFKDTKEELKVLAIRLKMTLPEVTDYVVKYYLDNNK